MLAPNQQRAAEILLSRRTARKSLAEWARVCGFEPAKHHLFLIEKLEAVVRGEIKRLAIFMPPGSAKSTYGSVLFPPWFLSQRPDASILTASHSADLATAFGRRARNLVDEHAATLGYSLRQDSQAADEWATTNDGIFFCAGVGSKIAGRRADLALIDDPIGSKEDAYSKTKRDSTWDWYRFDFLTRLKPNASIVLIQTRWHEDDLAGRILAAEGGEWTVINLPFLAKENDPLGRFPGDMLWPDYFDEGTLRDAQKDSTVFSALYQQDPTPEDGDFFKRDWIIGSTYERGELPLLDELAVYVASDHAVSQKQSADFTCIIPCGVDAHNDIWIFPDVFWDRVDSLEAVDVMLNLMQRRSIRTWWAESEKITKSIGPFLKQRMQEMNTWCYIEELHPSKDKQTRAQSIRARLKMGTVHLPRYATWFPRALAQMLKFPAGMHDDFVDAIAWLGLGLDQMMKGPRKKQPKVMVWTSPPITLKRVRGFERLTEGRRETMLLDY